MRPSASGKTRSARTLSASRSASASAVVVGDAEQHEQPGADRGDLLAVDAHGGAADALDERPHRASGRPQLRRGLLGRDDAQVDAGAELEPGEVGQPRQDVDPPAEVLGARAARCAPTG